MLTRSLYDKFSQWIIYSRDLYACDEDGRQLAVSTFQAHKQIYHSVAANQLAKDLQLN